MLCRHRDFADSKTLTAEKRDSLFHSVQQDSELGYCAEILSASSISQQMLGREKVSLNVIALNSTCNILRALLDSGVAVTHVYVDTVGDAERYAEKLLRAFPGLHFTVCPKADALFPVVSAASIVAKVTRDRALEQCQKDLGLAGPLGTGYPGDPDTKAWLKANVTPVFGFPPLVRFSWETCARALESDAISIKFQADEDDGEAAGGGGGGGSMQQRLTFGAASGAPVLETSGLGRCSYFRYRKLQRLGETF